MENYNFYLNQNICFMGIMHNTAILIWKDQSHKIGS